LLNQLSPSVTDTAVMDTTSNKVFDVKEFNKKFEDVITIQEQSRLAREQTLLDQLSSDQNKKVYDTVPILEMSIGEFFSDLGSSLVQVIVDILTWNINENTLAPRKPMYIGLLLICLAIIIYLIMQFN
jgi:hypothetical protein